MTTTIANNDKAQYRKILEGLLLSVKGNIFDRNKLMAVMRCFAVELMKKASSQGNNILDLEGSVLIRYDSSSEKEKYLNDMSKGGHWGTDDELKIVAQALDWNLYQRTTGAAFGVDNPGFYQTVKSKQSSDAPIIFMINDSYVGGGATGQIQHNSHHWVYAQQNSSGGIDRIENSGGGDCLFYALADAMINKEVDFLRTVDGFRKNATSSVAKKTEAKQENQKDAYEIWSAKDYKAIEARRKILRSKAAQVSPDELDRIQSEIALASLNKESYKSYSDLLEDIKQNTPPPSEASSDDESNGRQIVLVSQAEEALANDDPLLSLLSESDLNAQKNEYRFWTNAKRSSELTSKTTSDSDNAETATQPAALTI